MHVSKVSSAELVERYRGCLSAQQWHPAAERLVTALTWKTGKCPDRAAEFEFEISMIRVGAYQFTR